MVELKYLDGGELVDFPNATITSLLNQTEITFDCTAANSYDLFLRIANTSGSPNGYYSISIEGSTPQPELIAEDDLLCVGNELSVINIPSGATVAWSTMGVSLSSFSGNSVEVTNYSSTTNEYKITATVTHPNGCFTKFVKTYTNLGESVPSFQIEEIFPPCSDLGFGQNTSGIYSIANPSQGITYSWSASPRIVTPSTGTTVNVNPLGPGNMTLTVLAENDCGNTKSMSRTFLVKECDNQKKIDDVTISPNPADGLVTVVIEHTYTDVSSPTSADMFNIFITDYFGNLAFNILTEESSVQFDVANFEDGVYYLHVQREEEYVAKQFLVSH